MKSFNKTQFNTAIRSIKQSGEAMKRNTQSLIEMALDHFETNNDTIRLTQAVEACIGVRVLNTRQATQYIQNVAPVRWTTIKNKEGKKQKVFKLIKDAELVVNRELVDSVSWFDFEVERDEADKKEPTLLETAERKIKKGKVTVADMQATIAFLQEQVREAGLAIEAE